MKKILWILCFILGSCQKENTLEQIKKAIVQESQLLYVECDSKQQEQIIDLHHFNIKQIILLSSLLETDDSVIMLIETESKNQLSDYLKQWNPLATVIIKKQFVIVVVGKDVELVRQKVNNLER